MNETQSTTLAQRNRIGARVALSACVLTTLVVALATPSAHAQFCPPPPPPLLDLCDDPALQVDCDTGGDACVARSVFVSGGTLVATQCMCDGPGVGCGPVLLTDLGGGEVGFRCPSACLSTGETCSIYIDGIPVTPLTDAILQSQVEADGVPHTVTCECPPAVVPCSESAYPDCTGECADPALTCNPNADTQTCGCGNGVQTYENWVIADDFCVECPKCSCDVNGDGICNIADLQSVTDCINGLAGAPPTSVADLNCNGYCDQGDYDIVQCLIQGFSPDECCGPDFVVGPTIDRIEWFGSYLDPTFDPKLTDTPRFPDGWLIALHSDIPAQACPPPPSPNLKPVDWCGTLKDGPDGSCILFNPKGSAFSYQIVNPAALGTAGPGDMIRICGYLDPSAADTCLGATFGVVVQSVLECDTMVSRPDRLITQWAIPDPDLVDTANIGKVGWDLHPIYKYGANLRDACVMHDHRSTAEIGPNGEFLPTPGRTYWLSIQAEVGHAVNKTISPGGCSNDPLKVCVTDADCFALPGFCSNTQLNCTADADCPAGGVCGGQPTCITTTTCTFDPVDNPVTQDFWGWHTTPPGYQRKDDAYMGQLLMGNPDTPCVDDWFYDWMGPLHCSDPQYTDCCDDPTKSIDMAFYLMGLRKGICSNTGDPCVTNADCGGVICEGVGRVVHWCQPVNPGAPPPDDPPPPLTPTPIGGIDELSQTTAQLSGNLGKDTFDFELRGPTVIARSSPSPNPAASIPIEIIAMKLTSSGPQLTLDPNAPPSLGTITPASGASFDVFFEVNVTLQLTGQPPLTAGPIGMFANVHELPPANVTFVGPVKGPVPLVDPEGFEVGFLKSVTHFIPYKGGVNIHSDADWASVPTMDCCEPDPSTDTGCSLTLCPIDTEICLPFCVAPNVNGILEVNECDCTDPNKTCYATIDLFTGDVVCRGTCPPGQVCDGPNFVDTNADNIADAWKCKCIDDVPLGACCINVAGIVPQCIDNVSASHCTSKMGTFHPGGVCLGIEACCDPLTGACQDIDALCCPDTGGTAAGAGTMCGGSLEACCYASGVCAMEDPACCTLNGGTPVIGFGCGGVLEACCDNTTGVCTMEDRTCCELHGTPVPGVTCAGFVEACCDPLTGLCTMEDPACCASHGGTPLPGLVCAGVIEACCDPNTGLCSMEDPACCASHGGTPLPGIICLGTLEACCDPTTGLCTMEDPACCTAHGGQALPGLVCSGVLEACCDNITGVCTMEDRACCETHGTSQPGLNCSSPGVCGPVECFVPAPGWCAANADTDCLGDDPTLACLPTSLSVNSDGSLNIKLCDCFGAGGCGPISIVENPLPAPQYTFVCEKACPDPNNENCWVHLDGVAQIGMISIDSDQLGGKTLSCDCVTKETGACCFEGPAGPTCTDGVTQADCDGLMGTFHLNEVCQGVEACCVDNGPGGIGCLNLDGLCCAAFANTTPLGPGTMCAGGPIEACCDSATNLCTMEDRTCCETHGTWQGSGSTCTPGICGGGICELPTEEIPVCEEVQLTACISDDPNALCLPNSVTVNNNGIVLTDDCTCLIPDGFCGPVNVIGDPADPILSCEKACPIVGQICLIHVNGFATTFTSIPAIQLTPGDLITCDCVVPPVDCQPNDDGSACEGVCPDGKACQPQVIKCVQGATPPCRIIECGCEQPGDDCHIELGANLPVCAGRCPPGLLPRKCVRRKVDSNNDGIKDAWDCRCVKIHAAPVLSDPTAPPSPRYVNGILSDPGTGSVAAGPPPLTAIRVTFDSLHHPDPAQDFPCPPPLPGALCLAPDFSAFEGESMWVGPVHEFNEILDPPVFFNGATLHCEAVFSYRGDEPYSIFAAEIIPDSAFSLRLVDFDCVDSPEEPECWGEPLVVTTGRWGDVTEVFQGPFTPPQPNVNDIRVVIDNLTNIPGSPGKTFVHLHPNTPDPSENTNVIDLQNVIDAVKFFRYPWFGPCSCLPEVECVFGGSCDDDGDCLEGGSPCQTNADCGIGLACWHGFCTSATDQCGRCALP